jgi:MarR family transcriptional regulator, lower aerobic nicotinate degradation pathway regulator
LDEHTPLPPSATRRPNRGKAPARAKAATPGKTLGPGKTPAYVLDDQIGFILRQAYQKHALLFVECFGEDFTPTQWAAVSKLSEIGGCSQNLLGRLTAMDAATIKGVVDRLMKRGYIESTPSATDRRRVLITLTAAGKKAYERGVGAALRVSSDTLLRLKPRDRTVLLRLLKQLG